ncbi:MAG: hypothetical protein AVDCRST_MAG22-1695 [uncultured Rubrobacteraceae bacterium]|uniref:PRC-barrel domain-containing protein n=1 Tax=uncultured Rubrobacteraceae bacterium TaxID=349277 RepID=A0A6J4PE27_9ACTN|nr:MAG: hypothetical protein AVDCRST_MAG22-1695 [uncultured Rubrobacteraceae bacterium]
MSTGRGGDRFRELEQAYDEYTVYDQHYEKIGKVDDVFVDENDQPEYIGVKTGFLGMKSTLIPIELIRINDHRKLLEIAADGEKIRQAPTFDNDGDITPEYEDHVHTYFGLERPPHMQGSGGYGGYYDSPTEPSRDEELRGSVDTEYGERTDAPGSPAENAPAGSGNLDAPLGDTGSTAEPSREEPAASAGPPAADPFDADAATRTGGDTRDDVEVEGDRNVRVYKRAARPSR